MDERAPDYLTMRLMLVSEARSRASGAKYEVFTYRIGDGEELAVWISHN
jgi:hypothetical protein